MDWGPVSTGSRPSSMRALWKATDEAWLGKRRWKGNGVQPEKKMSLIERLRHAQIAASQENIDPWVARLQRVGGKVEFDGLERVSSQTLLDMLEVPQRSRTAGTYRRLAKLMAELGWTAVRVRDLTRGGYREQVRGYVRNAQFKRDCK